MFVRQRKVLANVCHIMGWVGGGIHKRIDENRELLELLRDEVPGFLAAHPEIVNWLQSEDDFLCELASAVPITEGRSISQTQNPIFAFPRPWPAETVEALQRQAAATKIR